MFKVGDKVVFGRRFGEQTLGEIVAVNQKTVKVRQLESRGTRRLREAGVVWKVSIGLVRLVDLSEELARLAPVDVPRTAPVKNEKPVSDDLAARRKAAGRKAAETRRRNAARKLAS